MSKQVPLNIHTQLDNEVALLIDAIDRILLSISTKKHSEISYLLNVRELPDNLSDTAPIEVCKLAAILGLKVASQVSRQKEQTIQKTAASN